LWNVPALVKDRKTPFKEERMGRNGRSVSGRWLIAAWVAVFFLGACATGPSDPSQSGSAPLVDPAELMVYSYDFVKPKPVAPDTGPLGNTKWVVASTNPPPEETYTSMVLFFQPDGSLLETVTRTDGLVRNETSRYHVVGSTMIINKGSGDVNARFEIEGNSLIMDTGGRSMLLRRVD
jgi:hypothetical protein